MVLITSLASCGDSGTVKIGFIAGLSGRNSILGQNGRNGVALAVEEINAAGGVNRRRLELLTLDHEGSRVLVGERTRELIEQDVAVILGPMASGMAMDVLDAAEDSDLLVLGPTVSTDELTGIDDNFLRIVPVSSMQGRYLAQAVKVRNLQSLTIVYDSRNLNYVEGVLKGFETEMAGSKLSIGQFSFQDKSEIPGLVDEVASSRPEGLLFLSSGMDAALFIQQYGKQAEIPALFGSSWVMLTGILESGGKAVEGMYLCDSYRNEIPSERELDFSNRFARRFGEKPSNISILAYELMMVYARAASESGSFNSEKVKQRMIDIDRYEGLRGEPYSLDQFGDVDRALSSFLIREGVLIQIHSFDELK